MWDVLFPYLAALLPTAAVGTLFFFLVKNILEGDRRERLAQSAWEKQQESEASAIAPEPPNNSQTPLD